MMQGGLYPDAFRYPTALPWVRLLDSADRVRLERDCVGAVRHQGFKVGVEKRE